MPHKMFVLAHQNCPLGYLIAVPKAVYMLLNHKIRDSRVQFFLVQWAGALLVMLGVGMCGFTLMPTLIAAGVFAPAVCFFALIAWLAAGDIFLKFALEDEGFYNLANESHALSIFVDADQLPSPPADMRSTSNSSSVIDPRAHSSSDVSACVAFADPSWGPNGLCLVAICFASKS